MYLLWDLRHVSEKLNVSWAKPALATPLTQLVSSGRSSAVVLLIWLGEILPLGIDALDERSTLRM